MSEPENLRQFFKFVNIFMLLMWRMGLGSWVNFWPGVVGRIMVITHTGRKSGLKRQTPVNYAVVDGDVYCIGSPISDWYRNIKANPCVSLWLPDARWTGVAQEVSNNEASLPILRQVLIASGFAAPLFGGFNPHKTSDADLLVKCRDYRLFRIRREKPVE